MTRKTRLALFIIAVLLFIAISCGVVAYALGYEYDFANRSFVLTGSFRVVANTDADVLINDKLAGHTTFLSNSFSRGRLLPRAYNVLVEKADYQTWQKSVAVYAGFFIDFPKVILLPKTIEATDVVSASFSRYASMSAQRFEKVNKTKKVISPSVSMIEIESPDRNKSAISDSYVLSVQWLDEQGYQPYNKAGTTEILARFPQKIEGIWWYRDSNHLIVQTGTLIKFLEIDRRGGLNMFDIASSSWPAFYNSDSSTLYYWSGDKLKQAKIE